MGCAAYAGPVTERTDGLIPEQSEGMKPTTARSLQAGAFLSHAYRGDRRSAESIPSTQTSFWTRTRGIGLSGLWWRIKAV